jgi:NAD(P)-dependent dehydrogenase (short-subunit alcohol dehydrogenase family)
VTDFHEKHVVVSGGGGALGRAVVELLLHRGAICHVPCAEPQIPASLLGLRGERLHATAGVDLGDESHVASYYRQLPGLWASLHLAGGFTMKPLQETSLAEFQHMFSLNAVTCFLCCREAVRRMQEGGAGGRLVNVAARPAVQPAGGMVAYTTAKAAVASLTACLAEELRAEGVLVNAVLPSIIDTPANRAAMPNADPTHWPRPPQIAEIIVFLASPQNQLTSGALVPVYGRA